MEYETYIEVNKRGIVTKIETDSTEESMSNSIIDEEEKEEEKKDNNLYD